jgi:hypothetical protein
MPVHIASASSREKLVVVFIQIADLVEKEGLSTQYTKVYYSNRLI